MTSVGMPQSAKSIGGRRRDRVGLFPRTGRNSVRRRYEGKGQARAYSLVGSLATASIRDRTWSFS